MNDGEPLNSLSCKTSKLDVTSPESIARFKQAYGDGPLDLLLNVAGELHRHTYTHTHTLFEPTLVKRKKEDQRGKRGGKREREKKEEMAFSRLST